jgi:hypothetical protein
VAPIDPECLRRLPADWVNRASGKDERFTLECFGQQFTPHALYGSLVILMLGGMGTLGIPRLGPNATEAAIGAAIDESRAGLSIQHAVGWVDHA